MSSFGSSSFQLPDRMNRILVCMAALLLSAGLADARPAKPLLVATYNLRLNIASDGENAWPHRRELVKGLIRFHGPDIFGTQEGFIGQLRDICGTGGYAFTGHGRDDGKEAGEHAAIFYRKERFELLKSGDFWLSETPDVPSIGWDGRCCRRICSWARFRDRETSLRFYFFSVHFDHEGVVARKESAKLMVAKIREIAGDQPVICVGDFNSTPETEQIATMKSLLRDAREVSETEPYGPVGTFNGFDYHAPLKERIDYIFVAPGTRVLKYGVLTDSANQRFPSDHMPVVALVILSRKK